MIIATALAGACGDASSSPTAPTATVATTLTEFFRTTVPVQGSRFYSFTLLSAGTVDLTLVRVGLATPVSTSTTAMGLGGGTPNGTECDVTNAVRTTPGLTVHLSMAMAAGTYCVKVFDIGDLTGPVNVDVRIVHR